jgi:hypothetical protein
LALGGISLAIVNGSVPAAQFSLLAASGSFFALAESGSTLYAASSNGGSVLLEKSTDQGTSWLASPVPYSAVAGGSPWTRSAVAVDGANLLLVASTGDGGADASYGGTTQGTCAANSTVLLASSPDDGLDWNTTTLVTPGLAVTSLQAGVVGSAAAAAWIASTTACDSDGTIAQAVTSDDAGIAWSPVQPLAVHGEVVPSGEEVEMSAASGGLVVAFGLAPGNGNSTNQLSLWSYDGAAGSGFARQAFLPAPTSWTLQGSPDTPAYLLTPNYLIPVTRSPYTALPFDQLQSDAPELGELPDVVSLVPLASGTLEIAATTPDDLGVDCWQFDTASLAVTQSCHVLLSSPILAWTPDLPIVALLDGGGWWVGIGASSEGCEYGCAPGGGVVTVPPASAPSASGSSSVGTSVCVYGCTSSNGLVAYSYDPAVFAAKATLTVAAGVMVGLGGFWLVAVLALAARTRRTAGRSDDAGPGAPSAPPPDRRRQARWAYAIGLGAWLLAWSPLAVIVLAPSSGAGVPGPLLSALVLGGALGAIAAFPLEHWARGQLLVRELPPVGQPFEIAPPTQALRRARTAATASAAVGLAAVLLALIVLVAGSVPGTALAPAAILLAVVVILFVALRAVYHHATTCALVEAAEPEARYAGLDAAARARTLVGAALLPCNPLVGLLLGLAFAPESPSGAFTLAVAFLPVTLLGIAVTLGLFGPTAWAPGGAGGGTPPAPGPSGARPAPAAEATARAAGTP